MKTTHVSAAPFSTSFCSHPRRRSRALAGSIAALLAGAALWLPVVAPAADITWGSATTISGSATDVSTIGTGIEADALVFTYDNNLPVVNGVGFSEINGPAVGTVYTELNLTVTGIRGATQYNGTNAPDYAVLLSQGAGGNNNAPMVISESGLTVGNTYSFQFWDQSGGNVTATAGNVVTLDGSGAGQFALGTFIADSTTESISIGTAPLGTPQALINAFQFRLTALPATDWLGQSNNGLWTGANWASDAANAATTAIPLGTTDVIFSATGAPNAAKNTTLGADFTIHSLTIQDSNTVTIGGANTLTISGAAGTGIDVQSGAGLFTMNANLILGGSSDTITVNNAAGAVINGTIGLSNGLTVNGSGTLTLNTAISGSNGLLMNGSGTLILNAIETFTGGTTVQAGTLQLGDGTKAAALVAATGSSTPNGTAGTGGTSVTVLNASTVNIMANATVTGGTGGDATLGTGGDGGTGVNFNDGGALTNNGTINGGTSGGGPTSGNGGTGVNFFTGGTFTNTFTNTGSVFGGSTASFTNTAQTGGIGVFFSGGGELINSGTIVGGAGTNGVFAGGSGGAGVFFRGVDGVFIINSLTNSGTIGGGGAGTGFLSNGTVGTGVVFTANAYGTLDNQNHGIINNGVSMSNLTNTVTLEIGSTINGALNIGSDTSSTLTLTDDGTGGTQIYSFAVTGATTFSGALTKSGIGTWILNDAFNYSGATTINDGTLKIGTFNALPAGTTVTINQADGSGTALLDLNGHAQTIAGLTFVAPNNSFHLSAVDVNGGVLTLAGDVNVIDATIGPGENFASVIKDTAGGGVLDLGGATRTFTVASQSTGAKDLLIDVVIQGNGGVVINASPSTFDSAEGGVVFGAANTYTGSTTVAQGRLTTTVAGALPSTTDLILGTANSTLTGDVDLDGTNQTVNSLAVAAGNTGGTGNFITSNNGVATLTVSSTTTNSTFGGLITGPLSLVKAGAGTTLTLSGANTFTGTTTISAGTVQAGSITAFGTGTISFTGGTLQYGAGITQDFSTQFSTAASQLYSIDTNSQNVTFATALTSAGGSLTKLGAGNLTLGGANTYGGLTTVSDGTLVFTGDTSLLGGNILDNAALVFNQAANSSFSHVISGSGTVTKQGAGTLTLSGANTFNGGLDIQNGTVLADVSNVGATSGAAGPSTSAITLGAIGGSNNATLLAEPGITVANAINLGTTTGALIIGNYGSNAVVTFSGAIGLNGNNLTIYSYSNGGASTTVSGGITGTGNLTLQSGGNPSDTASVILSGASVNNAGTITNSGIGTGGTTISAIIGSNVTGVIQNSATSSLTLTRSNSYGATTITVGTLVAGNTHALGNGSVANNGGTLSLANGTPAITIGGTYTQQVGGTLALTLHSNTVSDQVNVTGTTSLGGPLLGGTLAVNFNGFPVASPPPPPGTPAAKYAYTLLTSSGLTGTFTTFTPTNEPLNDTAMLVYTIDNVMLDVNSAAVLFPTTGLGLTPNQTAVLGAINNGLGSNPPPGFIALTTALGTLFIGDPGAFGGALDQLTPLKFENFASSNAFNNTSFWTQLFDNYLANHRGPDGTFTGSNGGIDYSGLTVNDPNIDTGLQMVHSRLLAWNPAPSTGVLNDVANPILGGVDMKDTKTMVSPEPANLWNVFISGDVVLAQDFSDPSAGLAHTDATTGAVQLGADYRFTPHFLVGAMFGYGHTDATLDPLGSTASVDTYSPGVYASYSEGGWYANALGSYGFADYDQNRNVAIGAFNGTAHSSPGGDQIVGNLDGGYDFHHGHWTFGPTLGLQYVHLDVNGFTETGLPGADLTVNQNESDSLRSRLGGRVSYAVQDGETTFTPHLNASWQHEFLDQSRGITSQFSGVGTGSFVVQTPNPSRDSALVDLGFDAQLDKTWTLFTDYTVQAGQSNYFGQSVQAGVKIGF